MSAEQKQEGVNPFVEQGISVFAVSDFYELFAAADAESAFKCACDEWGFQTPEEIADAREGFEMAGTEPWNLDTNKFQIDDEESIRIVTYREWLREMIARGESFPTFFGATNS